MTDQELRKLGRKELLELLVEQGRELEVQKDQSGSREADLAQKNTRLQELVNQLQEQLGRAQARVDDLEGQLTESDLQLRAAESKVKDAQAEVSAARAEAQAAQTEVQLARAAAESNEIQLTEAGSIAEAALRLNHVFEDAEKAAQQYLENVKLLSDREDAIVAQREQESKEKAIRLLQKTEERCREKVAETKAKCTALEEESRVKAEAYWDKVSRQMQIFVSSHSELQGLFGGFEKDAANAREATIQAKQAAAPAREAYATIRREAETRQDEPDEIHSFYSEPVRQEPEYEEPAYEEPVYEEHHYEEPLYEESAPAEELPTYEEPAADVRSEYRPRNTGVETLELPEVDTYME